MATVGLDCASAARVGLRPCAASVMAFPTDIDAFELRLLQTRHAWTSVVCIPTWSMALPLIDTVGTRPQPDPDSSEFRQQERSLSVRRVRSPCSGADVAREQCGRPRSASGAADRPAPLHGERAGAAGCPARYWRLSSVSSSVYSSRQMMQRSRTHSRLVCRSFRCGRACPVPAHFGQGAGNCDGLRVASGSSSI